MKTACSTGSLVAGCAMALAISGCTSAPLFQKQSFDFKTTKLFQRPCPAPDAPHDAASQEARVGGAHSVALVVAKPKRNELETTENRCNATYLEKMVENFLSIQEADEKSGLEGDTIDDVRRKGFTIHVGGDPKVLRPNTRALYGNDALAAVGMSVSAPPLQKPEDIKAYIEFMGSHYGEEYLEKDMKNVTDRFCLNRREKRELGDDRIFTIVWRQGRVIKRVIKGGLIDNPKQERGFLICPGDFIVETLSGTARGAVKLVAPIP